MDKTIVENHSEKNNQKEKTEGRIILRNLTKNQKKTILSGGASALLGFLGGVGAFSLMSFVENPDNIMPPEQDIDDVAEIDDVVENDGSIETSEPVDPDPVVIYTEAPFATDIDDSMSFNEAFSAARAEIGGGGGFFEWHGNTYGTYYKEEWDSLTEDDKQDYWESIAEGTSKIEEENIVEVENDEMDIIEDGIDEFNITEDDFIETIDIDGDGIDDVAIVDANSNDMPDFLIDTDMDGEMDVLVLDVDPETGEATGGEFAIDVNNENDYRNDDNFTETDNLDVDYIAENDLNPDIDIDNDMDMDDYIA